MGTNSGVLELHVYQLWNTELIHGVICFYLSRTDFRVQLTIVGYVGVEFMGNLKKQFSNHCYLWPPNNWSVED